MLVGPPSCTSPFTSRQSHHVSSPYFKQLILGLWLDFCFTNFLDFNCDGYYDGALSAGARGVLPFVFTFIRTVRARDFPTEGVLSRTPLIIRTVDQKSEKNFSKRRRRQAAYGSIDITSSLDICEGGLIPRPEDVRAAPGKEEPSMESAAGVEPAGLSHWTTSGKEGDGSHRQKLSKRSRNRSRGRER